VYGTGSQRLLALSDGRCYLYKGGQCVADISTKGPIQHAMNIDESTWIISGWREEIVLNETGVKVVQQNEVVMQHLLKEEQLWLLTNDGLLTHSVLTE
jgi:hypothetical protein